ncbi:MAG: diaminopimelate epimerase [Candidatus Aminicenantes bacterium]|nr:diaminopimelate epimerase [Candidatus Aminicenantes bacterium]
MTFYKASSFGNDFIVVAAEELAGRADPEALAREICDRRTGVGGDGVVFYRLAGRKAAVPGESSLKRVSASPGGGKFRIEFQVRNRDGGAAELSGNGMAALAATLLQRRRAATPLLLRTACGPRRVALLGRQGPVFHLDVEIGRPDFAARDFFPFLRARQAGYRAAGVKFYPVAVANPHAVVLCRTLPSAARLAALGKKLQGHALFPGRVNVEFVQFVSREHCRVFFYERGVGPTPASSTGSAAVFAVLRRLGLAGDRLVIERWTAPSGQGEEYPPEIHVRWQGGIHVRTVTRLVCKGEYFDKEMQRKKVKGKRKK